MNLVILVACAMLFGLLASALRLPPMIGFLVAGFALYAAANGLLPGGSTGFFAANIDYGKLAPLLNRIGDTGVTLLLFTIGLKLDLRTLIRPEVLGTALAHMGTSTILWAILLAGMSFTGLALFDGTTFSTYLLIGFALAFSSTIFVVKTLDQHGDTGSRFSSIAIGVLVIQDLAAALFMAVAKGRVPSIWALVVIAALVPARWVIFKILDRVGEGELLILTGIVLSLGAHQVFELVGLKGDLGAIVVGALVAAHPQAKILFRRLFSLRELLLVGFFMSIGQYGLPGASAITVAGLLTLALPLQTIIYLLIFRFTRLRVRTAAKSALLLTNYSEFGLIAGVVAVKNGWLDGTWMVALALAVTASFVVATVIDQNRMPLVNYFCRKIPDLPAEKLLPSERPVSFENIQALVFGMGEAGRGAYRRLQEKYGFAVAGVEQDLERVEKLTAAGMQVIEGDAADPTLWERMLMLCHVDLVLLAMPNHEGNTDALNQLNASDIDAFIAVIAQTAQQKREYEALGADLVVDTYTGVGIELADAAVEAVQS